MAVRPDGTGEALPFGEFKRRLAVLNNATDPRPTAKGEPNPDRARYLARVQARKSNRNLPPLEAAAQAGVLSAADVEAPEPRVLDLMAALKGSLAARAKESVAKEPSARRVERKDKKAAATGLALVLVRGIGQAFLQRDVEPGVLTDFLAGAT